MPPPASVYARTKSDLVDILYGKNPVLEALRAERPVRKIVVAEGIKAEERLQEILQLAEQAEATVEHSPRWRLNDMSHTEHHQGIVGYFHSRQLLRLSELLDGTQASPFLLVLDGIQDPQNLGALTRTAEAVGVDGIVLTKQKATALTPAAVKASAGASEHLRFAEVNNLAYGLEQLKAAGIWRVGLAGDAEQQYDEFDFSVPVALVVGSEGEGLRPGTRKNCDALLRIPMIGKVTSLNAAVAGGLLLYEVVRQRKFSEY